MITEEMIFERSKRYEDAHVQHGYYIEDANGSDDGDDYCGPCADRTLRQKPESEGWERWHMDDSAHHDYFPRCEICGVRLAGWLTDYGAEQELEYREREGFDFDCDEDCYDWCQMENSLLPDSEEMVTLTAFLVNPKPETAPTGN